MVMTFVAELWAFLRARKKLWLLPILLVLLLAGALLVLAQGSAIAERGGCSSPSGRR